MKAKWILASLSIFCLINIAHAQPLSQSVQTLTKKYIPNAFFGVKVANVRTGHTIYEYNAKKAFTPASNTKLFTAAAALWELGPSYRYTTTLRIRPYHLRGNTLKGNLYIQFSGDPSFTRKDLVLLIHRLKQKGIKQINGDIILDRSHFLRPNHAPGIAQDDLNWYYAAPVSAIIINQNYITLYIKSAKKHGGRAIVYAKLDPAFITIRSTVKSVSPEKAARHCKLLLHVTNKNRIELAGCWPIYKRPQELNISIKNPAYLAEKIIIHTLKKDQIVLNGKVRVGKTPKATRIIARHRSKPLHFLLFPMLKDSNNLYADSLVKAIGKAYYRHGSLQEGANAIDRILKEKTKMNFTKYAAIYDGAGTRYNLVTPAQLVRLLYVVYHTYRVRRYLFPALPTSGDQADGTLKKISSYARNLPNGVHAKTGSMKGVATLSGYIKTARGNTLVFSMLANNVVGSLNPARYVESKICRILHDKY